MYTQISLSYIVNLIFSIIYFILLTVIILSWMPIFDIRKEPLAFFHRFYKVIMAPFQSIIPPIGMVDISPIAAFIVLQILQQSIVNFLVKFGL